MPNSSLLQGMQEAVEIIATEAKSLSNWSHGNEHSGSIPSAISVVNATENGGTIQAAVKVDLKIAPQAAAYEYGSGIHGKSGQKYRIAPNPPKKALAFEWNPQTIPWGSPKFRGKSGDTYFFNYVEHPGVVANPFLRPALVNKLPEVKKIIGEAFRAEIIGKIREVIRDTK